MQWILIVKLIRYRNNVLDQTIQNYFKKSTVISRSDQIEGSPEDARGIQLPNAEVQLVIRLHLAQFTYGTWISLDGGLCHKRELTVYIIYHRQS